jgi:hypothetical protein
MNKIELEMQKKKILNMYHVPSLSDFNHLKVNAIHISAANSYEHELEKFKICYRLSTEGKDFITEAELNGNLKIRRDIVNISTGEVFEIETDKRKIAEKKETQKGARDYDNVNWIWIGKPKKD